MNKKLLLASLGGRRGCADGVISIAWACLAILLVLDFSVAVCCEFWTCGLGSIAGY